jgi:hypothetical protein
MIYRYSQFVSESAHSRKSNSRHELALLENEYLRLKAQGLSENEINENIFSSFLGSLGGGFTDTFKDYVIDWVAEKLGIEPIDSEGEMTIFYQLIRNVIEKIKITEIGSYFGKGSCKNWAQAIVGGIDETIMERLITTILSSLGMKVNMNTGFGGTIAAGLRETLTNSLSDVEFMRNFEKMISDKICGFSIGDVLSGNITTSDKQKLSSEIEKAEDKDPNIFAKAMKSGLGKIIGM